MHKCLETVSIFFTGKTNMKYFKSVAKLVCFVATTLTLSSSSWANAEGGNATNCRPLIFPISLTLLDVDK